MKNEKKHDLAMKDFQETRNKKRVKRLDLINNKRLRNKQHAKKQLYKHRKAEKAKIKEDILPIAFLRRPI